MPTTRTVTCPDCQRSGARVTVNTVDSHQKDEPVCEIVAGFACPRGCQPPFDTIPLR
ncbi:hypothetical protein [Kineococcus rhizosphaerae]|uniref:Uncharacterized protein n=1 Tax=Kineococcus rhizosphaerae TaxID=559628 RepID=A0A2T0QLT8_9ACTN|nr:hypothetical protein [Kineococcus rhizosphaerae]PRY05391.1 hypothetical protein CLV37_1393 [Kineococcus rhizosphaerae]